MRKAIFGFGLVLLTLGLVAAACGGGEEEEGGTPPAGGTTASGQAVAMEAGDFYFEPKELAGESGKAITVKVANEGKASHTFTIDELSVDQTLAPGEEKTITFTPSKGGTFVFYCRFHRSQGMDGTLKVSGGSSGAVPGGPASSSSSAGGSSGSYGGGY